MALGSSGDVCCRISAQEEIISFLNNTGGERIRRLFNFELLWAICCLNMLADLRSDRSLNIPMDRIKLNGRPQKGSRQYSAIYFLFIAEVELNLASTAEPYSACCSASEDWILGY